MLHVVHLSEIGSLMIMWQAFPPASVIFAGVGVLLLVCFLLTVTLREPL